MREVTVLVCLLAGLAGSLIGWGARKVTGISEVRAEKAATVWLKETLRYSDVEIFGGKRLSTLDSYDGPVWLVSAKAGYSLEGAHFSQCWGVVVSARSAEVYGAQAGEVPGLKCEK